MLSPCLFDSCICVSPPWNFLDTTSVFTFYLRVLATSLEVYILTHAKSLHLTWKDIYSVLFSVTLYDIDNYFLPLHRYSTLEEYYLDSSACYSSHNITCPKLAISAQDDPVCSHGGSALDFLGPGLVIIKTQTGGHLGFMESIFSPSSWIEKVALEWFGSVLNRK